MFSAIVYIASLSEHTHTQFVYCIHTCIYTCMCTIHVLCILPPSPFRQPFCYCLQTFYMQQSFPHSQQFISKQPEAMINSLVTRFHEHRANFFVLYQAYVGLSQKEVFVYLTTHPFKEDELFCCQTTLTVRQDVLSVIF